MESLSKKLELYAMVNAIESDFVEGYAQKLVLFDLPEELLARSNRAEAEDEMRSVLRGLDLQGYIEIANKNAVKLGVTKSGKEFLNSVLKEIIPIRNKVMHPRLLGFYDYPRLKACFDAIDGELSFLDWKHVREVRRMIAEDPASLKKFEKQLRKNPSVIENLPTATDFDDTSFIGRDKEAGEIKEKLFKKNVHILSIVGEGGVGKTAITMKLLYDLLDDPNTPFNLILFVSLKTAELNQYEFREIEGAIDSLSAMFSELGKTVGGKDVREELIELSGQFKALLVLDNLETVNTAALKDFLLRFSENGKVVITSRIGLGEMEYRYPLKGFSEVDLDKYVDTLFELYGIGNTFTREEKRQFAQRDLSANPLAIKWFARGLADGISAQDMLSRKGDLINFCMSNVYEKLSTAAKNVLTILKYIHLDITFAELAFIIGEKNCDDVVVRGAVNELCKCNFLDVEKFLQSALLSLTDFARTFIDMHVPIDYTRRSEVHMRRRQLVAFDQTMQKRRVSDPFARDAFLYEAGEWSKAVGAYYLSEALEAHRARVGRDDTRAAKYLEFAKMLCPSYFECNRVEAYFLRNIDPDRAEVACEIALSNAVTAEEKCRAHLAEEELALTKNDYMGAISALERAIECVPAAELKLERATNFARIGKYDEAENAFLQAKGDCGQDVRLLGIYATRHADLLRRRSEGLGADARFALLKAGSEEILALASPDRSALDQLAAVFRDMLTMAYNADVGRYVYGVLKRAEKREEWRPIFFTANFCDLRKKITPRFPIFADFEDRAALKRMIADYDTVLPSLKEDEGIVYHLRPTFGFLKTEKFPDGVYFSRSEADYRPVCLGDVVGVGNINIVQGEERPVALSISFRYRLYDDEN